MAIRGNLALSRTALSPAEVAHLGELVAQWQLLADLSFADLTLWVPLRSDLRSWPSGHLAIAHIRPTTAATVFSSDPIGREVPWGSQPRIEQALSLAEIVRDNQEERVDDHLVREEAIPVHFEDRVIAVISRMRNIETMRTPSKLELNYREMANQIHRMISQGTFPLKGDLHLTDSAPRVGDGLIRLDATGEITYASPNALSAFNRMGWQSELIGTNLGDAIDSLAQGMRTQPSEEGWKVTLSGRHLRRREFENSEAIIDFLAIPLIEGGSEVPRAERIGAMILVHDVTELRRKERALLTKDATIREIHHRVKNNLQTVSALLRLQARRIDDPRAAEALEEAVRRVASIAIVHETLASNTAERVDFDGIVDRILHSEVDLSLRSVGLPPINYRRDGEFGELPAEVATPLALILTELIHNAIEHGLRESGSTLTISALHDAGARMLISVADDGSGLGEGFSITESGNLGLEIVRTLTENELQGSLTFAEQNPGVVVEINIPFSER
ncbi:MAG: sensor histidine kinase [Candidatus Nanopelagicaceae bacterium]